MKVRLIKKSSIEEFVLKHSGSRLSFRIWLSQLKRVNWNEPGEITSSFGSADLLGKGSNRVVFDIAGNNYRIICKCHFGVTRIHIYIKWIGTHAEYTKLCEANQQYIVNNY